MSAASGSNEVEAAGATMKLQKPGLQECGMSPASPTLNAFWVGTLTSSYS